MFYASDEFYVKSGAPIPRDDYYGEYTQIENGVGMLTSFEHEFESMLKTVDDEEKNVKREVSVATGEAAYKFISSLVQRLEKICPNLTCRVYCIKNEFFGGEVTVTGLLTGQDVAKQLAGQKLGEILYLSRAMLRAEGDLFLCGMTPAELSEKLGVKIEFTENDGAEFLLKLLGAE